MSHPHWRRHRIGARRLRKAWRLVPGTDVRADDRTTWGTVSDNATRSGRPDRGQPPLVVQLGISAVVGSRTGRPYVRRFQQTVDHRTALYSDARVRALKGRNR